MKSHTANRTSPIFWSAILLLSLAIALSFISEEVKYYALEEETLGRYWKVKWWLVGHLSGGILALLLGPFQFWTRFRNKYLNLHRLLGKIYIGAIAIASLASTYMAWTTALEIHFTWALSLQILALVWITTVLMAYRTIRLKRIQQHKEWMIRSYLVTFVFIGFRYVNDTLYEAGIGTFVERAPTIIYLLILLPLLAAEIIFQWKKK